MVQEGNTDSLPVEEIILAIPITFFGAYLGYKLLVGLVRLPIWVWRHMDVAAHKLAGMAPPHLKKARPINLEPLRRKKVWHEGQWTVHGYEDLFVAEKRL